MEVVLLDVGQDVVEEAPPGGEVRLPECSGRGGAGREARREVAVGGVVVVEAEADLLEVVQALRPGGRLADLLDGGQQEPDEDRDDRDHHQQLDQREGPPAPTAVSGRGHVAPPVQTT